MVETMELVSDNVTWLTVSAIDHQIIQTLKNLAISDSPP